MSEQPQVRMWVNGKEIFAVDGMFKLPPSVFEAHVFAVMHYKPPIRITWIRPRYGLRRPKAGAN